MQQNIALLKHQFKRFFIGFHIFTGVYDSHFYILEWNQSINDKMLNQLRLDCQKDDHDNTESDPQIEAISTYMSWLVNKMSWLLNLL